MFFMFAIVGKVVNLLLPFVTSKIFFQCSFCILLALDEVSNGCSNQFRCLRELIIFLFLLNKNILISNLFLLRCFCAIFFCYA